MKSIKLCKAKGIGLLELMLSLAIIAILLIMATRYYQSASNSQKVSQAVDMFAAMKGAAQNYHNSQGSTGVYASSVAELVGKGYLPASYLDGGTYSSSATSKVSSPWNTAISISGASGQATVSMVVPDVQSCEQVVNKLAATISSAAGESITPTPSTSGNPCTSKNTNVEVFYAITQ
jgi:type II secretory pathway pseudopilin PulG